MTDIPLTFGNQPTNFERLFEARYRGPARISRQRRGVRLPLCRFLQRAGVICRDKDMSRKPKKRQKRQEKTGALQKLRQYRGVHVTSRQRRGVRLSFLALLNRSP